MKNLLTFVSPAKRFNDECQTLVQLQIDNSLSLGWKPEDIILATNFEYEFRGVKSLAVPDECYCSFFAPTTKVYVINYLLENDLVGDELYWYHDFDCYQFNAMEESEFPFPFDLGVTNYGRMPRLCSASMFFTKEAKDIYARLKEYATQRRLNEEESLMALINSDEVLQVRAKLLNISYAFHRFNLRSCYPIALKPIRAAHFHPTPDKIDFYIRGLNKLGLVLMPERLIRIFETYGYA